MSGERRGLLAAVLRAVLRAAALVYAAAILLRRALYALGLKRPARAGCPVISVGNLVAGGTGKTPMVEHLARRLLARGRRPAIVSRGYKSASAGPAAGGRNDEALVLAANLPGVPQVISPDRVRGAARAVAEHGADAVLLDDGFQHWRIARDLDLVLVDALAPFGHGRLLPRGLLREPLSALRRAHAVAITRADLAPPGRLDEVRARIRAVRADLPVLEVVEEPVGAADLAGKEVFAFCGIGNPDGFFRRLESLGARLSGRRAFDDHHAYTADELAALLRDAGSATPVTTQKDAVKLAGLPGAERVEVLKIRVAIRSGEEKLEALIESSLRECAPNSPNPPNSPKHREGRCCSGSTLSTRAPSSTFGVFGGFGEFGANSQVLST